MPISSFPISVNASVNLSDINIDTDLDLSTNKLIINDLNSLEINSKSLDKYIPLISSGGYLNYSKSGSAYTPFYDGTEYSTNSTSYSTKITQPISGIDNSIPDGTYCLCKSVFSIKAYNGSYSAHVPYAKIQYNGVDLFEKIGVSLNAYTQYTEYDIIQSYQAYNFTIQIRTLNAVTNTYLDELTITLYPLESIFNLI